MTDTTLQLSRRNEARGFTLTEMAIVLGIIGIILGAIWVAASAVYENIRVARAAQQVMQIVTGFRSIWGGRQIGLALGTDITSIAINNGFMPTDMLQSGNTTNGFGPWGGSTVTVTIPTNDSLGPGISLANCVKVVYSNLGQTACNHFANAIATSNAGAARTYVNGIWRTLPPFGTDVYFSAADINSLCTGGSGNVVFVIHCMN